VGKLEEARRAKRDHIDEIGIKKVNVSTILSQIVARAVGVLIARAKRTYIFG